MRQRKSNKLHKIILFFTIGLVLLSTLAISYYSLVQFEKKLIPEMDKKAQAVGESVNSLIVKTVNYGNPFQKLSGMDQLFSSILKDNPEIKYLAVVGKQGKVLYHSGVNIKKFQDFFRKVSAGSANTSQSELIHDYYDNSLPIINKTAVIGYLHLGVDKKFFQNKLKDILFDIITVLVVSFLFAFELVVFLVTFTVSGPMMTIKEVMNKTKNGDFSYYLLDVKTKDEIGRFVRVFNEVIFELTLYYNYLKEYVNDIKSRMGDQFVSPLRHIEENYRFGSLNAPMSFSIRLLIYIRPALFLLIFAESLSLSFFPMYVDSLYDSTSTISKEVVIGLPISIFMLFWALSLPSAGAWSDRIGRRKPFLVGALTTTVGLIATGFASTVYDLLVWRSIVAVGYGIVFITCQGYITDNTGPKNRSKGMAMFVAGFFAGSLSGAAIGGILAQHIGPRATFFLSGALSIIAAIFVYVFLQDLPPDSKKAKRKFKLKDFALLFANKRFLFITILSAIPAKISLVGFLYYAAPIYLKQFDITQSSIGRVIMAYGLAIILISPIAAKLADAWGSRRPFVIIGGILSGLGLLMVLWWQTVMGIVAAISLVGFGHAVGVSSQLALITEYCKKEEGKIGLGTVMGIFRLIERIGNITGPLIIGTLIAIYGSSNAKAIPIAIAGIGIITIASIIILAILLLILDLQDKSKSKKLEEAT